MSIFGKDLSEYYRFQRAILGLILIVGLARAALSMGGVPTSTVKFISVIGMAILGMVYYSIRVHTSGFGSYKELLPLLVIQNLVANVLIAAFIVLAIFTGKNNIFSLPEFSGGTDGKTWTHAGAHLVLATIGMSLVGWLVGSAIMFITKKVVPANQGSIAPKGKGKASAAGA